MKSTNMKAIVVYGENDVRFEDMEVKQPGPGEVLIKVMAAGICGTDADILSCSLIYYQNGMSKLPIVPGHEWAGAIVELGENVTEFEVGDRVAGECTVNCGHCPYCSRGLPNLCANRTETGVMNRDGGYAEYMTFPVTSLHKCNGLSFEQGACIEPTCIAMHAIMTVGISPYDNVLVMGPGPIGLMAAQIAKKVFNANMVFLSGTRDDRLNRASGYGLNGLINVRQAGLYEEIQSLTHGKMIDVIVEASGAVSAFTDAEKILNPAGRISLLSFYGNKRLECNWDFFSTNGITIHGSIGSPRVWPFVISKMESGVLDVNSIISHRLPLKSKEDFMNAFMIMEKRMDCACKVIVKP